MNFVGKILLPAVRKVFASFTSPTIWNGPGLFAFRFYSKGWEPTGFAPGEKLPGKRPRLTIATVGDVNVIAIVKIPACQELGVCNVAKYFGLISFNSLLPLDDLSAFWLLALGGSFRCRSRGTTPAIPLPTPRRESLEPVATNKPLELRASFGRGQVGALSDPRSSSNTPFCVKSRHPAWLVFLQAPRKEDCANYQHKRHGNLRNHQKRAATPEPRGEPLVALPAARLQHHARGKLALPATAGVSPNRMHVSTVIPAVQSQHPPIHG